MVETGILAGRLALITGGGSGIGRAVCSVFAREGAILAVADINIDSGKQTILSLPNAEQHEAFAVDVGSTAEVTSLIQSIEDHFHRVPSVVVHAAGIFKEDYFLKLDEQSFDDVVNVNLKGTFLINQAIGQAMVRTKVEEGSIVNISSIVAMNGSIGYASYAASKAGVIGLTKTAAKELARYNIRVNVVLPGFISTPMTAICPSTEAKIIIGLTPLGRMGQPEEVAEVCAFLASSRSSYMTGATIEVTGGLNF